MKAVRGLIASVSSTCQYPDCKSRLAKIVAPSKQSKESSILGRLCASLIVQLLSFLKSIQNHRLPSFLQTNSTGLAQGLVDCCITPMSNISCKCFLTSSYWWGGILQYLSLKSVSSSNLMSCWTKEVLPNLFKVKANRCWYSLISTLADCCCCSFQDSTLQIQTFQNFFNPFFFCFKYILE